MILDIVILTRSEYTEAHHFSSGFLLVVTAKARSIPFSPSLFNCISFLISAFDCLLFSVLYLLQCGISSNSIANGFTISLPQTTQSVAASALHQPTKGPPSTYTLESGPFISDKN